MTTTLRRFVLEDGPEALGVSCDQSGASLARTPLLAKTAEGFQPRPCPEIDMLLKAAYGQEVDAELVVRGLAVVADALNAGESERAMVAALHLRLPPLEADGAVRLGKVDDMIAKYRQDQPRDWHGRWTADGSSGDDPPASERQGSETSHQSAAGLPLRPNAMRIEPRDFQANPNSPNDVPTIVRGFIESGAGLNIRELTEGDTREIAGDIQSTSSGYVIENSKWGNIDQSGLPITFIGDSPAPVGVIPFYFHSHSSTPSSGSVGVDPGPSDTDVDNSHKYGVWQVVIDKDGYVYLIDPTGGLVRSDGSILAYAQAKKTGTSWVLGSPRTSFPNLENHANAFGHVRNVHRHAGR